MVKVVYLLPGFPENENDENCLPYIQDLIELLSCSNSEYNFEVVALHYPFTKCIYYWNGIKVHALAGKNQKGLSKIKLWIRSIHTLFSINRKSKIELIHCFWLNEPALLAQIFKLIKKTPIVVTIIGQDPLKSNKYLSFLKLSTFTLVAISSFVAKKLNESRNKKVDHVIPLVLNLEKFRMIQPDVSEGFDIIGVGNLSALKNYKLFIEVIELVKKDMEIKAVIIGSGYQKDELLALINEKKLAKNIELLGEMDRKDIFQIMNVSKVLLHTSNYESQGFAMSEALFLGMKVVSTNVGDNETKDFIDVGSSKEELANLVKKALLNNKRESILFYNPNMAVTKYLAIYRDLIWR